MTAGARNSVNEAQREQRTGAVWASLAGLAAVGVGGVQLFRGDAWGLAQAGVSAAVTSLCAHAAWRAWSGARSAMSIEARTKSALHCRRLALLSLAGILTMIALTDWFTHDGPSPPPWPDPVTNPRWMNMR